MKRDKKLIFNYFYDLPFDLQLYIFNFIPRLRNKLQKNK